VSLARLLCFALVFMLVEHAHAQEAHSPLSAVVPSESERLLAQEHELERKLADLLSHVHGVRAARVVLTLPDSAHAALDRPLPGAKVSALLTLDGASPDHAQLGAMLRGAAAALSTADVTFTHTRVSPQINTQEPLVSVGPFRVTRATANSLRVMLAASLMANVTLATFLIVRLRRRTRAQRAY
jgi:hypothetical protein